MRNIAIVLVIVALLSGTAVVFVMNNDDDSEMDSETTTTSTTQQSAASDDEDESTSADTDSEDGDEETAVVTYTDSGFSPSSLGPIEPGTTVTFMNESSKGVWVASDVHPTHQELPGFDSLGSVAPGESYEYTFEEEGTWDFHNHLNSSEIGTVTVGAL